MTSINFTTRILTASTLVVALLLGDFAMPATGDTASTSKCCKAEVTKDSCRTTCCDARAPRQNQPQSNQSRSSNDRQGDGKAAWIGYSYGHADLSQINRVELSSGAPVSGSSSLITQHVRLQI